MGLDEAMGRVEGPSELRRFEAIQTTGPRWSLPSRAVLCPLVLVALVALFYHGWLQAGLVTAGDWPYRSQAGLRDMVPFPSLWNTAWSTGAYDILSSPSFPLLALQGVLSLLHVDWTAGERLLWMYPALVVPSVSTYALALSLFRQHVAAFVAALSIVMNSYVYLLYEGGQFTVAMGYGFMPLVLWAFLRGQRVGTVKGFILTGLLMAVQAMYDIRSTYIVLGVCLVYGLICCVELAARSVVTCLPLFLKTLGLPHIATALVVLATLHLWWILPSVFVHAPALPSSYTDVAGVRPLSHMQLSNSLALFHPFWLANNLGVSPINPLFFITPLVIFAVLLQRRYNRPILFLAAIALMAAFLVKGDNDPAGGLYDWLFVHLPGFSFFRDPSKFYQPLALAYALLLGAATARLHHVAAKARAVRRGIRPAVITITGVFLIAAVFPAYPALLQQGHGALAVTSVPSDYARLNEFIDRQHRFFRVLWAPALARFATASSLHPALDVSAVSTCCIRSVSSPPSPWWWLALPTASQSLHALAVRYIVVPDDTKDDDYVAPPWPAAWKGGAPRVVLATIRASLPGLHQFTIGRLHIFIIPGTVPLLSAAPAAGRAQTVPWCTVGSVCIPRSVATAHRDVAVLPAHDEALSYVADPASWYDVRVRVGHRPVLLVLAQTYDPHWLAFVEPSGDPAPYWTTLWQQPLPPRAHALAYGYANAWLLSQPGAYHVVLLYWPQRLVLLGLLIAALALLSYGAFVLTRVWRSEPPRAGDSLRRVRAMAVSVMRRELCRVQENRESRPW